MAAASSEALTPGAVNPMESAPEGNTARPGTHEGSGSEATGDGDSEERERSRSPRPRFGLDVKELNPGNPVEVLAACSSLGVGPGIAKVMTF
jgi:hypothetical protein